MGVEGIGFPAVSADGPFTRGLLGDCAAALEECKVRGWVGGVGDLATWTQHATDGDPYQMEGDGHPYWMVINDQVSKISTDSAALDSIGTRLSQHWEGDAADDYTAYLASMRRYLDNHVQQVDQAQDTLQALYSVLTGFKKDLYNLASATFDACGDVEDSKHGLGYEVAFGVIAVAGLAVGGVGAGVAGVAESFAVATAGSVASAAGGELGSYGVGNMHQIGGKTCTDVFSSFDAALGDLVKAFETTVDKLGRKLQTLAEDIEQTAQPKAVPVPRYVMTNDTTFNPRAFFSPDAPAAVQTKADDTEQNHQPGMAHVPTDLRAADTPAADIADRLTETQQ